MATVATAAVLAGALLLAAPPPQEVPAAPPRDAPAGAAVAPKADLDRLTLVGSRDGEAVVRFTGAGAPPDLVVLTVGDRVGRTAATVREIAADRLVLDEVTRGEDGRPRRTQIVYREGHAGGRRYMRDPGEDAPPAVRPEVIGPDGKPVVPAKRGKGL
jgi:hypothetical protein